MEDKIKVIENSEAKPTRKPKRVKVIPCNIIHKKGKSVLVEWVDGGELKRGFIPYGAYNASKKGAPADDLKASAPYGLAWEEIEFPVITAEEIAGALRKAGVWTADDLRSNPNQAINAIQSAYRVDLAALLQFVKDK